eukprot:g4309.t1
MLPFVPGRVLPWKPGEENIPRASLGKEVSKPAIDPFAFKDACIFQPIMTTPIGMAMGGVVGVLIGSWESMSPPILLPGVPAPPSKPVRHEFRISGRVTMRKMANWGKNFGVVTAVFSTTECAMQKLRGKKDLYNSVIAGGLTGAMLAIKQGPKQMAIGAIGFAAFSVVIDSFMGH